MTHSLKALQARAEDLFGEACKLRGYDVEKLATRRDVKTPDFRLRFQEKELIAEVKSPGLEPQIKELMGHSRGTFCSKPGKRVRDLIRDSEDQLAAWAPAGKGSDRRMVCAASSSKAPAIEVKIAAFGHVGQNVKGVSGRRRRAAPFALPSGRFVA